VKRATLAAVIPTTFGSSHTPFAAIGGETSVRALVDEFYDRMDHESGFAGIRALHQPDLSAARDKLFWFLCGWLGGPDYFVQRFGHPRLRARHLPFPIGTSERDQWLACMRSAMDARAITGDLRAHLDSRFAQVADFMRNAGEAVGQG